MENDVRLLQQLLALGDSIQELKSRSESRYKSQILLNCLEEERSDEDEKYWPNAITTTFDNTLSSVTHLYVDDEPKENQQKQYFSRKNSVLRIPIPPRSSNRMSTNKKLQRRLSQLSQNFKQSHSQQLIENSSQTENFVIPQKDYLSVMNNNNISSFQQSQVIPTVATSKKIFGTTNTRISNGSIDSGIRDESCSNSSAGSLSPILKNGKL
ncbi:unnamed protein product [Thelazia callipaeda]|uniref:Uncharacterized protein n=1 Tax=Thelazia callipaeda TaxID=103827 RepID=A0A0N5CWJ4_THECL|nr:unnamed protein product [Thelazia callipaeda]